MLIHNSLHFSGKIRAFVNIYLYKNLLVVVVVVVVVVVAVLAILAIVSEK